MKQRIEWIDIAKGIGILCVIIGHINVTYSAYLSINRVIFLFHMPIFFVISGFLYKKETIEPYTIKKVKSLLTPYFSSCLLLFPILIFFISSDNSILFLFYTYKALMGRVGDGTHFALTSLWFLPCLFLSLSIYNILQNILSNKYISIILCMLYIAAAFYNIYVSDKTLPWSIHALPISLLLLHIGYIYKIRNITKDHIIFIIMGLLAIISPLVWNTNTMDINTNKIGIPIITLLCSVLSILFIKNMSFVISKNKICSKVLSHLGQVSLTIMIFHMPVYYVLRYILTNSFFQTKQSLTIFVILTTVICCLIHMLLSKFRITRILFLGEYKKLITK